MLACDFYVVSKYTQNGSSLSKINSHSKQTVQIITKGVRNIDSFQTGRINEISQQDLQNSSVLMMGEWGKYVKSLI